MGCHFYATIGAIAPVDAVSLKAVYMANIFQKPLQSALTNSTNPMPEHGVTATERILIIEDGSALRRALRRLFESEGYSVDLATEWNLRILHISKTGFGYKFVR